MCTQLLVIMFQWRTRVCCTILHIFIQYIWVCVYVMCVGCMHRCMCMLVCIVFLLLHHTGAQTQSLYVSTLVHRMENGRRCVSSKRRCTKSLLTLPHLMHKFSCCVVVCCSCLHQLCCFHVVLLVFMSCCCVLFCTIKAYKVQLPQGSVSKKYKTCFTCTCCYPGIDLVKTCKVYKHFKQQ